MAQNKITPFLWFDGKAAEAAQFYTSVFPNSKVTETTHYLHEIHGQEAGSVMTVSFELNGHPFVALNGGPMFKFTPATSFQILCADQAELDHYYNKLGEGGDESKLLCGWLEDKYGLSWQVVPSEFLKLRDDKDTAKVARMISALLKMKKLDVSALQAAFDGKAA